VKNLAEKAQKKVERNWQESQYRMERLAVILLKCTDKWEGSVEY